MQDTTRGFYRTQLRYQVIQKLREGHGFNRTRWIAKDLGANPSSVHYQLQQLMMQGLVAKAGRMYCWKNQLQHRTVAATYDRKRARNLNNTQYPDTSPAVIDTDPAAVPAAATIG